jgi:hypothetical protein
MTSDVTGSHLPELLSGPCGCPHNHELPTPKSKVLHDPGIMEKQATTRESRLTHTGRSCLCVCKRACAFVAVHVRVLCPFDVHGCVGVHAYAAF